MASSPWTLFVLLILPTLAVSQKDLWFATIMLLAAAMFVARGSRWLRVIICPFVLVSMLQVGYYLYSDQQIDKFFWMAIQSTDRFEAASFFQALTTPQLSLLVSYIVVAIYLFFCFCRSGNSAHPLEKSVAALVCVTVAYQVIPAGKALADPSVRDVLGNAYYGKVLKSIGDAGDFTISSKPMYVAKSKQGPLATQILVVIGESASRLRMGAYGYTRNTTPLIGRSALLFKNNIAVGLNTQPNVQTLLTGLLHIPENGVDQDIFRAAKAAGYTSIVIDNNDFKNDDPVVKLSMQATHYISMNGIGATSVANDDRIKHDQVVIKPFSQQMTEFRGGKALYLVHLMGSHPSQDLRYPGSFNKFPSYYDNSILYTNYILSELRSIFMARAKGPAIMLYVADHGVRLPPGCGMGAIPDPEDVSYGADDRYFSNYAIPLVVWANADFRSQNPQVMDELSGNLHKPTDQMFLLYSVSELMGISDINGTPVDTLSIFSKRSDFEPRLNVFGKNIDKMFEDGKVCVAKPIQKQWSAGLPVGEADR